MASHRHRAYDFSIETPFPCPELAATDDSPDVCVTFGPVPGTLADPRHAGHLFEAQPGRFLLRMEGVARYLVEGGRAVIIDPSPRADPDAVRLFFVTTCLTVILLERGTHLTLHSSAVRTTAGAVVFAGYSGSGKSTLLCEFLRRGCTMLSDDVVPLRSDGPDDVVAQPAFPYVKLCEDAAVEAGYPAGSLPRIRRDARVDKFGLAVEGFSVEPAPVRAVYVLVPSEQPDITFASLDNVARMRILLARTAGAPFLEGLGRRDAHFRMVTGIGARLTMTRVFRPRGGLSVRHLADAIEADLG